ncbi:hypothetical protein [Actinoplanes friuliensis]|jgi:hypothetical protein|uniref:Major cell-surface adhesin PAc n=1 Tax=Actinoplanes friuliensis DSM 7358 TaxID=1246995 RepID=U5VTB8_9ACTN|nr:hypothetical protein [Actinoplanes friuliensis]AGZ40228.1 Major cell-surface adhesin PAc [Actinoplanes friuliensis DSM 7358]
MTLWRRTRTEVAGAVRSVRYDMGRREADEPGPSPLSGVTAFPDVTSTGMSTFGGAGVTGGLRTSYGDEFMPRPRRLAAVAAFGVLAVAGAAGSYFAVVNGIGSLAGEKPAGAEPYPLAAEAPHTGELSNSGFGRGTAAVPDEGRTETAPAQIRVVPTTAAGAAAAAVEPGVTQARPQQTTVERTTPATRPTSCCLNPPVPTPTVPVPTPHSPSVTPSPTASSPETTSPTPTETVDPVTPSASDEDEDTGEGENHARRARRH